MLNTRIDLPLQGDTAREPLGLIPYADALTDFIKSCETPLTVGIQGDWGIGKTSLLNLVRHRLGAKDKREYPTIYFNTWQYAQLDGERHLTVALLGDLVRRIGELDTAPETSREQARSLLRKVGRMAASAGSQMLESKVGFSIEKAVEDGDDGDGLPDVLRSLQLVVEYKAEFERLVRSLLAGKEAGSRLVVMIDDLDRIRPARALDLLASVKNFLDVPGCVFLLAVDYEVIQRGVAETMGVAERKRHGKSYFDKIIQVPFNMPVASYNVRGYVMALLGWDWVQLDKQHGRYEKAEHVDDALLFLNQRTMSWEVGRDLENLTLLTVGRNPRAIKRAANYFALLKRVFDANGGQNEAKKRGGSWQEQTLRLLYGMACFQLAYPELFTLFVQQPTPTGLRRLEDIDVLGALPQMRAISERVADPEATKSEIAGFFDQIVSIVDEDGSGDISAAEFGAVLDVLKYARLTNAKIEGAEDGFAKIRERVLHFARDWSEEDRAGLDRAVDAFERSDWNDGLRLRIREAGARFFNLTWNDRLLGSVASAQKAPLQFYLKDPGGLLDRLPERARPFVREVGHGHYGVGSLQVDLWGVAHGDDAQGVLRDLLRAVTAASETA